VRQAIATILLTSVAAAITLALLYALGPDWASFAPATCLASHCFCESLNTGALILQPANSWSSLGFVLVGFWIMLGARAQRKDTAFRDWPALWFGLTAVVIGVGSFLLHATLTLWGQFYDVLGMYLMSGFVLTYAVQRWRGWSNGTVFTLYIAVCALLVAWLWATPEARRWLFALVLALAIPLEMILARPRRPKVRAGFFYAGLIANTAAFAIWSLDNTRTLCAPDSLLQGHAVWHVLGAVAVLLNYSYYRSECAPPERRGAV